MEVFQLFFLNFPTDLDNRKEYKMRGGVIASAILELSKMKYKNIIPVTANVVEPNASDSAVYHFSDKTYKLLAYKISKLNLKNVCYKLPIMFKLKIFLISLIPCTNLRKKIKDNLWENFLNV